MMKRPNRLHMITPNPDRAARLNSLGIVLRHRFERTGLLDDSNAAVEANKEAVRSTPHDHPNRMTHLNSLGIALQRRFERLGSINDLNAAVEANEEAVKL